MASNSRLATTLCGIPLTNPVLAASGTFAYGIEFAEIVDLNLIGGIVVKGLSRSPIEGNKPPRLWETASGMMNSIGLQNIGVREFVRTKLPGLRNYNTKVVANVFGYDPDQPPLLDGLDITIEPGEFVAVVGPSGSGKSTVMRLILGFETPWSGVVSFDGQDLADLDVAAVRRQMGTVLQTSMPFGTTYRECICGPLQISDERLWQVIAESGLEPEVRARGLDVPIGDRGGAISGGQRQRLMIARALAKQPRRRFQSMTELADALARLDTRELP
jgi:ABC-type transport system involved in Fe-S cluster assembly fused permease/ATPase subunit